MLIIDFEYKFTLHIIYNITFKFNSMIYFIPFNRYNCFNIITVKLLKHTVLSLYTF